MKNGTMQKGMVMLTTLFVGLLLIPTPAHAIRVLVALGDRVQEIDTHTNSVTWEYVEPEGHDIFTADRLSNGNTLMSINEKAFEVNPFGNIVWEKYVEEQGVRFYDAQRQRNGDTLIGGNQCLDYDPCIGILRKYAPAGELVWSYSNVLAFTFGDADRFPNGNTLLASDYAMAVMEIDSKNNVVWNYNDNNNIPIAWDADRLPNGNTLVSGINNDFLPLVREVTPGKATVWEYNGLDGVPEDADRLPNQTTLIADGEFVWVPTVGRRIILLSPTQEILWQYGTPYPPRDVDAIPPTNLTASGHVGKIVLDWDDYEDFGETAYNVYRATLPGGPYTLIASPTESRYQDKRLRTGVQYYYVVTAANPGFESDYSHEATAIPKWKAFPEVLSVD